MLKETVRFDPNEAGNEALIDEAITDGDKSPTAAKVESNGIVPLDKQAWIGGTACVLLLLALGAGIFYSWGLSGILAVSAVPFLWRWAR